MKIILLLCLGFSSATAQASPVVRTGNEGLMGGGNIDEFVVLDVNENFGALKFTYHLTDEEYEPIACKYPGLEKYPTSGVDLALLELVTGKVTLFKVYEVADDGAGNPEREGSCTPHEESVRRLEAAKLAFEKAGLDPERRPQPDFSAPVQRGSQGTPVLENTTVLSVTEDESGTPTTVSRFPLPWKAHPLVVNVVDRRSFEALVTAELADDNEVFYRAERNYTPMQAGTGDVTFPEGYQTAKGMVFLEVFHSFTAMRDSGDSFQYGLTPPIPPIDRKVTFDFELNPRRVNAPVPRQISLVWSGAGGAPSRVELGEVTGVCTPIEVGEPGRLLNCWNAGQGWNYTASHVGDSLVVERQYVSEDEESSEHPPERLHEVDLSAAFTEGKATVAFEAVHVDGHQWVKTNVHTQVSTPIDLGKVLAASQDSDGHWWIVRQKGASAELIWVPVGLDIENHKLLVSGLPVDVGHYLIVFPDESWFKLTAFEARRDAARQCGDWSDTYLCDESMGWTEREVWTWKPQGTDLQNLGISRPSRSGKPVFTSGSPPAPFESLACECWGETLGCGVHTPLGGSGLNLMMIDIECGDLTHPTCVVQSADKKSYASFEPEKLGTGLDWVASESITDENMPYGSCGPFLFSPDGDWVSAGEGIFCGFGDGVGCTPKLKGDFLGSAGLPLSTVTLSAGDAH
jgi:hypothetical protein